jgi:hypothetical protein
LEQNEKHHREIMESRKEEMHLRKKESESAQLMSTNVSMAMAAATDTYMMEMLENMKEKNRCGLLT